MRAWFDDIMFLVWVAEEWSIPQDLLPGVEERKDLPAGGGGPAAGASEAAEGSDRAGASSVAVLMKQEE